MLLVYTFIGSAIVTEIMYLCKINIFKFTVLMGTFALAMAFAGNDLVNFIGVPLAGLDSYNDFAANAHGASADSFMMSSLMSSAKTPPFYLIAAGIIMIVAMATSKKARNVIKTSVDLSRQDEGDEMFGSSVRLAPLFESRRTLLRVLLISSRLRCVSGSTPVSTPMPLL
jgi:hypothetical protein